MTEETGTTRVELRMTAEELRALDALCVSDRRTRPMQLQWLVDQEVTRRGQSANAPHQIAA